MKRFALFIFLASFATTASSYANHHENIDQTNDGEESFYGQYHEGYGQRRQQHQRQRMVNHPNQEMNNHEAKNVVYKIKKGKPGKKRKYPRKSSKRDHHKKMMQHMKKRLNKLPADKKDAALKEIERHHQEMRKIIGDEKSFPEFGVMKKAHGSTPPPTAATNAKKEIKAPEPVVKNMEEPKDGIKTMPPKRRPVKMKPATNPKQEPATNKESNNNDNKRRIGHVVKMV